MNVSPQQTSNRIQNDLVKMGKASLNNNLLYFNSIYMLILSENRIYQTFITFLFLFS